MTVMKQVWAMVLVLACGAKEGTATPDAHAIDSMGMSVAGGAGGDDAGHGGTGGVQAAGGADAATRTGGTSGSGGTGGAGGGGSLDGPPSSPDTAASYQSCPQAEGLTYTGCGYPGPGFTYWVSPWKDGLACAVCVVDKAGLPRTQHTGCTMKAEPGTKVEGPGPVLCVKACGECCYRRAGGPCSTNADCCAPLRCQGATCG